VPVDNPRVVYTARHGVTPEEEICALSAVYKYVLFDFQARRGDPHDLTTSSTAQMTKNGPQKTEREKT
jgi:hypothetical protein